MNKQTRKAIIMAILAATLYGISAPISKILLREMAPTFIAALLYLGAGIGMLVINGIRVITNSERKEAKITKKELPFIVAMIFLDILAPILLMTGLAISTAGTVSLINNFEIVATSIIALLIFKEAIGKRIWIAIILITISTIILSYDNLGELSFSLGSIFVVGASICWGFENNVTRMLSLKDPLQVVVIKGIGSGAGALLIAIVIKETSNNYLYIILAMLLGFVAYGLGIYLYIMAQRTLGAARTSAFYAVAPFVGVIVSFVIFKDAITVSFLLALLIMLIGSFIAVSEKHNHGHMHQAITHDHKHNHLGKHHNHQEGGSLETEHNHVHTHKKVFHKHSHSSDMHHNHDH